MPPIFSNSGASSSFTNSSGFGVSSAELRQQWTEPTDVFSILLLLGGEIVNKALAQLAGGGLTPVTFSFGWVSYAVTTLLASVGDAKLMPSGSEDTCLVLNATSGYLRTNDSWVLGRMIRDYETWMDPVAKKRLEKLLDDRHEYMRKNTKPGTKVPRPARTGLCIAIYEPCKTKVAGESSHDLIYWSGFVVAIVQLIVAAIPLAISKDWAILMITVSGTMLALVTGSLPQWKAEKWSCRRGSTDPFILTSGNGSQHAIVILGNGKGLNLEDLAVQGQMECSTLFTRLSLGLISILWISLLIAAAGLAINTWYLLAVGSIGILQNVLVAGWRRNPSALGVHLVFREVIGEMSTMETLLKAEAKHLNIGRSLLPIFFPGELYPEEILKWEALKKKPAEEKEKDASDKSNKSNPKQKTLESWIAHAKTFERSKVVANNGNSKK